MLIYLFTSFNPTKDTKVGVSSQITPRQGTETRDGYPLLFVHVHPTDKLAHLRQTSLQANPGVPDPLIDSSGQAQTKPSRESNPEPRG